MERTLDRAPRFKQTDCNKGQVAAGKANRVGRPGDKFANSPSVRPLSAGMRPFAANERTYGSAIGPMRASLVNGDGTKSWG
jgi:hypothetical protein